MSAICSIAKVIPEVMALIILKWIRIFYYKTISSIAFIPAVIALVFLTLSFILIEIDFSETGKAIKSSQKWLRLRDADTARSIISTIAAGIISLTVFSFSMVMILLSQVASHLTNRVLDKLIGNRFQQTVLGFYIGTLVYSLFLLSSVRDIDSGVSIPSLSTYLLITFTIIDIFFFIYFLHYITRSVIYETIIRRIHDDTKSSLLKSCTCKTEPEQPKTELRGRKINAYKSGIFQGFQREKLLTVAVEHKIAIKFLYPVGTFVLKDRPLLIVDPGEALPDDFEKDLATLINIHRGQAININYYYGFRQLVEIAVKALSPGVNDPGTAILCLQSLIDLLEYRIQNSPQSDLKDDAGHIRIISSERTFDELFEESILPIWDYGKNDRLLRREMGNLLRKLDGAPDTPSVTTMLKTVCSLEQIHHDK